MNRTSQASDPNVRPAGTASAPTVESEEARGVNRLFELEFQSLILGQVSDAIISIDNAGLVTYLNASAEHQYEFANIDAVGGPLSDLYAYRWLSPQDEAHATESLERQGFWRGENLHVLRSGPRISPRAHQQSYAAVEDADRLD